MELWHLLSLVIWLIISPKRDLDTKGSTAKIVVLLIKSQKRKMIENESLITCLHESHKRLQSLHMYASYSTYAEVPKVKNTKSKQKRKKKKKKEKACG